MECDVKIQKTCDKSKKEWEAWWLISKVFAGGDWGWHRGFSCREASFLAVSCQVKWDIDEEKPRQTVSTTWNQWEDSEAKQSKIILS